MDQSVYVELKINTEKPHLEPVVAAVSLLYDSLQINDDSDLLEAPLTPEEEKSYPVSVSLYFPEGEKLSGHIAALDKKLSPLGISPRYTLSSVSLADYADTWKAFYTPQVFEGFTVVPAWERYTPAENEKVIYMDPGQVFGAGTHETTRLALALMTDSLTEHEALLDVGTGSGILSIVAHKLFSADCTATDLDPDAVRNAEENMKRNGIATPKTYASDLLTSVPVKAYDTVVANMVAGLLLRLIPTLSPYLKKNGKLILSGIIDGSRDEVKTALRENGFTLEKELRETDWNAFLCRKQ